MTQIADPTQLFLHKLGATLTMEETVVTMLQELQDTARDEKLQEQLAHHREETRGQIENLRQAFAAFGKEPQRQPCPVIDALDQEGKETLRLTLPQLHDAVILSGCAEVEHHEIAVYNGLIELVDGLDMDDVVALLEENLEQEEHTLKEVEKAFEKQAKTLGETVSA